MKRITQALAIAIVLAGCDDSSSGDVARVYTTEELESIGPVAFSTVDHPVVNTSGKGESAIATRAYVPDDDGSYPLVLVLPGFSGSFQGYESYSRHLASHGNLVFGVTFTGSDFLKTDGEYDLLLIQVRNVIEFAQVTYPRKLAQGRIGIVGHSLGGKMAFYAAAVLNGSDPSAPYVAVAVGLDPSNSGGAPCFIAPQDCIRHAVAPNPFIGEIGILDGIRGASLILRSEPDPLTNPELQFNAELFFRGYDGNGLHGVPAPALYFDMGSASHASYAIFDDPDNAVPRLSKRTTVAWLKRHLEDESGLEDFFTGSHTQREIVAGLVVAVEER